MTIPKEAATLHFGNGSWHIYAGKKEGPRIKGHILIIDGDAYLMLGSEVGFAVGGGTDVTYKAGDCGDACAYVKLWLDMGMGITLKPIHVAGDFDAGAKVGGCFEGVCANVGANVGVHAAALPPELRFKFSIGLSCPIDSVDITLAVLPKPDVDADIDWCDYGLI